MPATMAKTAAIRKVRICSPPVYRPNRRSTQNKLDHGHVEQGWADLKQLRRVMIRL